MKENKEANREVKIEVIKEASAEVIRINTETDKKVNHEEKKKEMNNWDLREMIRFLAITEKLKCNTRHSWTSSGRHESVAEHTFRLILMADLLRYEFPKLNVDRIMRMCLWHDIGEAITGDIPAFNKNETHEKIEKEAVESILNKLPGSLQKEITDLFLEMDEQISEEAKIYKALDKMETIIQHNEASITSWLPLEYEKNLTYGEAECAKNPIMMELKKIVNEISLDKMKKASVSK